MIDAQTCGVNQKKKINCYFKCGIGQYRFTLGSKGNSNDFVFYVF